MVTCFKFKTPDFFQCSIAGFKVSMPKVFSYPRLLNALIKCPDPAPKSNILKLLKYLCNL